MNKKVMKLLASMFILVMVVAGCSTIADEETSKEMETFLSKTILKDRDIVALFWYNLSDLLFVGGIYV